MSEKFPRELWDNPAFHKGREWGRMEERERIIKLLEERHQQLMELMEESADDDGFDVSWYITQEETVSKCIALIKGENK